MNNDFFDKIEGKATVKDKSTSEKKNMYQVVAIILLIISGLIGIIFGVKEECTTGLYGSCSNTFDFSYTLIIWAPGFITFLFMYGFGEIIKNTKDSKLYLKNINEKLKK